MRRPRCVRGAGFHFPHREAPRRVPGVQVSGNMRGCGRDGREDDPCGFPSSGGAKFAKGGRGAGKALGCRRWAGKGGCGPARSSRVPPTCRCRRSGERRPPRAQLAPELWLLHRVFSVSSGTRRPSARRSRCRLRPLREDESDLHINTSELKGETEEGGGGQAFLRRQTLKKKKKKKPCKARKAPDGNKSKN